MCTILIAYQAHPAYRLVVVANRDEFLDRPTQSIHFWDEHPHVLAGKDVRSGGTWMGATVYGKFAVVTNFREKGNYKPDAPSRGVLPLNYLVNVSHPYDYLTQIHESQNAYNGFNLIVSDIHEMWYLSNRHHVTEPQVIHAGIFGLSNNHLQDVSWPKVERGKTFLQKGLKIRDENEMLDFFWGMMRDKHIPPDDLLPDTGLTLEQERALAALFVELPNYQTRSTSIFLQRKDSSMRYLQSDYVARTFNDYQF